MANRRPQGGGGRRDFGYSRNNNFGQNNWPPRQAGPGFGYGRNNNFGHNNWDPWQGGPGPSMNNQFDHPGGSFSGHFPPYMPNNDFYTNVGQYDPYPGQNWMGNQGDFHNSGNFNSYRGRGNNGKGPGPRVRKVKATISQIMDPKAYDHIKPQFLICHVCKVQFPTGEDFMNHLKNIYHKERLQVRLKMYNSTINKMRGIFKVQHMNYAPPPVNPTFFCTVCELHADDEVIHCMTIEHKKLQKLVQPSCLVCKLKDWDSRHAYEEHRFTPEHIKNVQNRVRKMTTQITNSMTKGKGKWKAKGKWKGKGKGKKKGKKNKGESST